MNYLQMLANTLIIINENKLIIYLGKRLKVKSDKTRKCYDLTIRDICDNLEKLYNYERKHRKEKC